MSADISTDLHHLEHVQLNEDGTYTVECSCKKKWRRDRLADAAVALERHQVTELEQPRKAR